MAYIGVKPTIGNFQICDAISVVNGQAAYTMQVGSVNVSPQSANHMIVSLNGVIQKPGSSYTVSGNTITFASNLATGDVIDFIQILGDVLDLGVPSDATVTAAKLTANSITGQTAETSIATDDTVLIHDTSAGALRKMTRANFVSGVGGENTPSWRATMSTAQTNLTSNTAYLVHFDTEVFDTDGAYTNTTSNFKFTVPSGKAGKYFIGANLNLDDYGHDANYQMKICWIYVNGSSVARGHDQLATATFQANANNFIGAYTVQDLSVGDYVQVYGQVYNNNFDIQTTHAEFYGYKLIG